VLIIIGLVLAGNLHFLGAQSSTTANPTPTPTSSSRPSSTPFPGSTPIPTPTPEFPIRTNVNGTISSDTTWTKANSPYNLTGPVTVNPGVTLSIEPGTIVDASYLNYLLINGTINARGTSNEQINFNGGAPVNVPNGLDLLFGEFSGGDVVFSPSSSSWNQQTQSGNTIENAVIEDLVINGGSPKISNDAFLNIDIYGGSPEISNSNIKGGIGIYAGSAVISNNIISQQAHYLWGVYAQRYDRNNAVIFVGNNASVTISSNLFNGYVSQVPSAIGFGTEGYTGTVTTNIVNNTIAGFGAGIAVSAGGGKVSILSNSISSCYFGVEINDTDPIEDGALAITTTIQGNLLTNNTIGVGIAYPAEVENNTISNNRIGISISAVSSITYNNIIGNDQSVYLSTSNNLNATYNWWGTTDTQSISQSIHDSKFDPNLGTVNFVPFLSASNPQTTPNTNWTAPTPTAPPPKTPTPTPAAATSSTPYTGPTPTPTPSKNPASSNTSSKIYIALILLLVAFGAAFVAVMAILIRERRRSSHL
jgi:hypothetical protein